MATARHRRRWASTARLWPRGSSSAARSTQREQISALGVADVSFRMQLSMEETTPASPSTGMGSSARSCARSRLPSSGAHGRSDCRPLRFRGNACCAVGFFRSTWPSPPKHNQNERGPITTSPPVSSPKPRPARCLTSARCGGTRIFDGRGGLGRKGRARMCGIGSTRRAKRFGAVSVEPARRAGGAGSSGCTGGQRFTAVAGG